MLTIDYQKTKFNATLTLQLIGVTHVIHNAWPVKSSHSALSNFFRLSIQSAGTHPAFAESTRVLFASSITVAGRFPTLNPEGPLEVPETHLDALNTVEFGYPEAKWVCEQVGKAAAELYGQGDAFVRASSMRIGQRKDRALGTRASISLFLFIPQQL